MGWLEDTTALHSVPIGQLAKTIPSSFAMSIFHPKPVTSRFVVAESMTGVFGGTTSVVVPVTGVLVAEGVAAAVAVPVTGVVVASGVAVAGVINGNAVRPVKHMPSLAQLLLVGVAVGGVAVGEVAVGLAIGLAPAHSTPTQSVCAPREPRGLRLVLKIAR